MSHASGGSPICANKSGLAALLLCSSSSERRTRKRVFGAAGEAWRPLRNALASHRAAVSGNPEAVRDPGSNRAASVRAPVPRSTGPSLDSFGFVSSTCVLFYSLPSRGIDVTDNLHYVSLSRARYPR
ncbi:hypothetical protein MRX96_008248 [Rhipicephalus microplus]